MSEKQNLCPSAAYGMGGPWYETEVKAGRGSTLILVWVRPERYFHLKHDRREGK